MTTEPFQYTGGGPKSVGDPYYYVGISSTYPFSNRWEPQYTDIQVGYGNPTCLLDQPIPASGACWFYSRKIENVKKFIDDAKEHARPARRGFYAWQTIGFGVIDMTKEAHDLLTRDCSTKDSQARKDFVDAVAKIAKEDLGENKTSKN